MSEKDDLIAYAADNFGVDLDKRKGVKKLKEDIEALKAHHSEALEVEDNGMQETQKSEQTTQSQVKEKESAQSLADRIWAGQSASLPRHMRISRIASALKDKGYEAHDIENLRFPE